MGEVEDFIRIRQFLGCFITHSLISNMVAEGQCHALDYLVISKEI